MAYALIIHVTTVFFCSITPILHKQFHNIANQVHVKYTKNLNHIINWNKFISAIKLKREKNNMFEASVWCFWQAICIFATNNISILAQEGEKNASDNKH